MLISIVGNAESIFNKQDGHIIDKADMVFRFNGGVIIKPESQGTKTTVLVFSKWRTNLDDFGKVELWQTQIWGERRRLQDELGIKPSNGLILLYKLSHHRKFKNAHVQIFGFDWKATKTWYRPDWDEPPQNHNYEKEKEICLKIFDTYGWTLY